MNRDEIHLQDHDRIFFSRPLPVYLPQVFSMQVVCDVNVTCGWLGKQKTGELITHKHWGYDTKTDRKQ